ACIGCSASPFEMPSMVTTLAPSACPISMVQDFTARPSIWTTQAPHWLVSQPTCVPVRFRFSRRRWTRSVRSSTSTETALPFTVSLTVDTYPSRFLIGLIRDSGREHCNWEIGREAVVGPSHPAVDPSLLVKRLQTVDAGIFT